MRSILVVLALIVILLASGVPGSPAEAARPLDGPGGTLTVYLPYLPMVRGEEYDLTAQVGGDMRAVAVDGRHLYAGEGPRLVVYDLADPAHPQRLGQTEWLDGLVEGVTVTDGRAFVTVYGHLYVMDVTTPSRPLLVFDYPAHLASVTVVGDGQNLAAVTAYDLVVLAVSPDGAVAEVGHLALMVDQSEAGLSGLVVLGRTAYVGWADTTLVVDLSVPTLPRLLSAIQVPGRYCCVAAHAQPDYLYLRTHPPGVAIWDVTVSAEPREVGQVGVEWVRTGAATADRLYLIGDLSDLIVVDVSRPELAQETGRVPAEQLQYDLAVAGHHVYLAGRPGLTVVEASDPEGAGIAGQVRVFTNATDIVSRGARVFAMGTSDRLLWTLDASDPANPRVVGTTDLPLFSNCLALAGDTLLVGSAAGDGSSGGRLTALDVRPLGGPAVIGDVSLPGIVTGVAVDGPYAYALSPGKGWVVDIAHPEAMRMVAGLPGTHMTGRGAAGGGRLVAVDYLDAYASVHLWEVDDPPNPRYVGALNMDTNSVAMLGQLAYLGQASLFTGVTVLDLVDADRPRVIDRYAATTPTRLVVDGDRLLRVAGSTVAIDDLIDPAHPATVGEILLPWPTDAEDATLAGDHPVVTAGPLGVAFYRRQVATP